MGAGGAPGQAQQCAPGVHIPIRRAQTGKGADQINAAVVRHGFCQQIGLVGGANELQLVPQPLDGGAGVEHAALQNIGGLAGPLPADGGQQAVFRAEGADAGVHQREAAGAIGVFRLAGGETALTEQRRLLVAGGAGHRDARQRFDAPDVGADPPVDLTVGDGPGQKLHGHPQRAA